MLSYELYYASALVYVCQIKLAYLAYIKLYYVKFRIIILGHVRLSQNMLGYVELNYIMLIKLVYVKLVAQGGFRLCQVWLYQVI